MVNFMRSANALQKGGAIIVEVSLTLTSTISDPLVTDLVQMSNEQIRYILDNANDFLLDVDEDDGYTPEKDKPNFEDWNEPSGGTFGNIIVYRGAIYRIQTP